MATIDEQFAQTAGLIEDAFKVFTEDSSQRGRERAQLMVEAATAGATLLLVRENRVTNLLAAAYAPAELGVDPALTRAAYQEAVTMLGFMEDEPEAETVNVGDMFADLHTEGQDPADKDVTE